MNYDKLLEEDAKAILKQHDEADWSDERLWNEVIEPSKVLYFLDAFGDQSLAINCQGLPKDLPDKVVRKVNEYDVFSEWDGTIEEHTCPTCNRTLYEFGGHPTSMIIDEYGDDHTEDVVILGDPAGQWWDSNEEHRFMCAVCRWNSPYPRYQTEWGVKVYYGAEKEWYSFRHSDGVIIHDSMSSDDPTESPRNIRDKDGNRVDPTEIESAFAKGGTPLDELMHDLGFVKITKEDVRVETQGLKRTTKYADEILEDWATAPYDKDTPNTHPDFNFTYFIENGRNVYCPEEERETVLYHLEDQVLMRGGTQEQVHKHRGMI